MRTLVGFTNVCAVCATGMKFFCVQFFPSLSNCCQQHGFFYLRQPLHVRNILNEGCECDSMNEMKNEEKKRRRKHALPFCLVYFSSFIYCNQLLVWNFVLNIHSPSYVIAIYRFLQFFLCSFAFYGFFLKEIYFYITKIQSNGESS